MLSVMLKTRELELIDRFKKGDEKAFDELVVAYSPKLYRVAYALLDSRQDAEEVVQDAFIRAHRALPGFRGDSSFETWMHRITINLARNRFHWNRRRGEGVNVSISAPLSDDASAEAVPLEFPDTKSAPDRIMENEELGANILKALQSLPESLRETMVLRHVNEMPYEQIAERLDCKVGTVKSRLARGRELLRNYLLKIDKDMPISECDQDDL